MVFREMTGESSPLTSQQVSLRTDTVAPVRHPDKPLLTHPQSWFLNSLALVLLLFVCSFTQAQTQAPASASTNASTNASTRTTTVASTGASTASANTAATTNADTQPDTQPDTSPESTLTQRLSARLINPQLDSHLRAAAAADLIRQDTSAAVAIIRQGLANHGDPSTQLAILSALVAYPEPPRELAPILLAMFDKADASLFPDIAWALGRYDDHLLQRDLVALAQNETSLAPSRVGAILTLGQHRTQANAKLLMKLIEPDQSPAVRQAAFKALVSLSSEPELGNDLDAWRQWWEQHRRLSAVRWDALLLTRFSQRAQLLDRQRQLAVDRLVQTHRQLLRATPHDDRSALLVAMLQDPLEPLRLLAVEQLDQRARSGELTDALLRQGLLERLDDPSPAIRLATAKLLRNLRDESGSRVRTAQAIAQRLASLQENNDDVLRAYLLLLTDTPAQSAVAREIDLLRSATLREDAAGALASAIDQKLVDPQGRELLKTMLAKLVPDDHPPEPKLIDLLGKVGGEKVWQRISKWLENPDEQIQLAAARAWAQSDRSMAGLAPYMKQAVLQPIIIDAAYRRGKSVATLMALIQNKPRQEQLAQSWQAALVAMAGRLSPAEVLQADAQLAKLEEPLTLRAAFVGAAAAALDQKLAAHPDQLASASPTMADLYLHNARLLLGTGRADSALGQLNQLQKLDLASRPLTESQQLAMAQLKLEILSAMGDLDRAIAQSDQIISRVASLKPLSRANVLEPMAGLFFNWTARSITTSQFDQANRILVYLRAQFDDVLTGNDKTQLASMEAQVNKVRNPPATPTTQPAATASNPASNPTTTPAATEPAASPSITPSATPAAAASSSPKPAAPRIDAQPSASVPAE